MSNIDRVIYPVFDNPKYEYRCKHPWPVDLYLQGRNDTRTPGRLGVLCSFEIYMDDMWFAGRGATIPKAEEDAWETWQNVLNCGHDVFMTDEHLKGIGSICAMCGIFKRDKDIIKNDFVS